MEDKIHRDFQSNNSENSDSKQSLEIKIPWKLTMKKKKIFGKN